MTQETEKSFYNTIYKNPNQKKRHNQWDGYKMHIELSTSIIKGEKILDIGCGEGIITNQLKGKNIYGIDLSQKAISYSKSKENKYVKYAIASALKLPFKEDSFDCISILEVVEHLEPKKVDELMEEIRRVCKKSGKIIVSTPNLSSVYYATFRSLKIKNSEHINEMDFIGVINTLTKYFNIEKIYSHTGTPWFRCGNLTKIACSIQKIYLKIFPEMKSLFYSQIYVICNNTKTS